MSRQNPPTSHPQFFEEAFQRIQSVTGLRTQQALASLLEIRQSSISDAKNRNSIPPDWVLTLFSKLGVNPDWLLYGVGPVFLRTDEGYGSSDAGAVQTVHLQADCAHAVTIPLHGLDLPLEVVGRLAMPRHLPHQSILVFRVDSDALFPVLQRGAFAAFNTAQKRPVSGEIFACALHEGVVFRRLHMAAGHVTLRSTQPYTEYPELSLSRTQFDTCVLGRLAWVIQAFL